MALHFSASSRVIASRINSDLLPGPATASISAIMAAGSRIGTMIVSPSDGRPLPRFFGSTFFMIFVYRLLIQPASCEITNHQQGADAHASGTKRQERPR